MNPLELYCFFIMLWYFVLLVGAFASEADDGILVLSKDTFDEAYNTHKTLMVMFHAPSCSHCTKLAPIYANAAVLLKE